MKCPVCDVVLVISSREGIEIDHCPQCRGVWLDRGELDKIIERAAPSVAGAGVQPGWGHPEPPPRGYQEPPPRGYEAPPPRDDDRYRRKRRRSFLEDIFDFD